MTNKNFFTAISVDGLKLGSDFELRCFFHTLDSFVFSVLFSGNSLPLHVKVRLTKRSIITDIYYTDLNICKYSPYELREWCPAIFLPYTNFLHWQKFLKIAFEIFIETNPNFLK